MSKAKSKKQPTVTRDRIKDFRRVLASELLPNPKNWRTHPEKQQAALRAVLDEIGYADALIARELPSGQLMLVDGHLRAETTPHETVPVLVLDVSEAEADKLLVSLDPLAALAGANKQRLDGLLRSVQTGSQATRRRGESTMRGADGKLKAFSNPAASQQPTKIADSVFRVHRARGGHGIDHPAIFPVEFTAAVMNSWPGTVYDPFCGSGTTLIAAEQLGHHCFGMELEPAYCDVVVERWQELTGRKAKVEHGTSPRQTD